MLVDGRLQLHATVISVDGRQRLNADAATTELSIAGAEALGAQVTETLLASGAAAIVDLAATKPKPLTGRRLLVPSRCPSGLVETLRTAGAEVTTATFTDQELLPLDELEAAVAAGFDWLVVTSSATVSALESFGIDQLGADVRVAAIGPATARALTDAGLPPTLVASPGGGASLVAAFPNGPGVVLLPGAAEPSAEPAAGLAANGWTVRAVTVYRTVECPLPADISMTWSQADALVVTAGSVARAAAKLGLPGAPVIAIGVAAAEAARAAGLSVIGVAASPDTGGVVDAVLGALG
ncbi:MAG: uroporphyrinogen-III synthase [Propionibacteriales bacterium]|nr:uroporphyrinogen-III synthase [Propionibacteriales bacterium]